MGVGIGPAEGPHLFGEEIGAQHHFGMAREELLPGEALAVG
jgi:hypothetical protein